MKRTIFLIFSMIVLVAFVGRALIYCYNLRVTSWYRTPWHNLDVGGKWASLHLIGWAYDVTPVNVSMQALLKVWPFKYVVESDHVHMQIL